MIRPTVARVDLQAIRSNLLTLKGLLSTGSDPDLSRNRKNGVRPPPGIIAVVKANAYGHGAGQVALALEDAGAAMLACADIEEGIALRQAGIRAPILVFGALSVSDLDGIFTHDLTPTISTPSAARALEAAAARHATRLRCHLKIDTGMNRLGFRHDNIERTLPAIAASAHLEIDALYTHFATADNAEHPAFELQRERFDAATAKLTEISDKMTATNDSLQATSTKLLDLCG
jgi:alanine racemase